jgi:4-amino-4-deoxy-L-arabinose transferase-like glycosyltransferase
MPPAIPTRPRSTLLSILLLWIAFYASFTLLTPPLLDDADSVHAEVAREMLLRHDYITLYANGIRYLEKAPLLYWSMAASMRLSQLLGATSPTALAIAARIPLSLTVLALALLIEAFARRIFTNANAGLYAALITLSSPGIFLFTRITIPDAMVCLWTTLALYAFHRTEPVFTGPTPNLSSRPQAAGRSGETRSSPAIEARVAHSSRSLWRDEWATTESQTRRFSYLFALACALNVLTKGLIGIVFPIAIVLLYLLLTRGPKNTLYRLRQLHPLTSFAIFLILAAPWHILAGLANPTQGHPTPFHYIHGHWQVPLPTDGNVRGWFWFYFMNEHLLRYLNLRVPHDYDTAPLWLFWGLCLIWLMPWSAFLPKAISTALPWRNLTARDHGNLRRLTPEHHPNLLLILWAALPLLFFSLSTRQEYYVLPALPALTLLIAGWLGTGPGWLGNLNAPPKRVISTEASPHLAMRSGETRSLTAARTTAALRATAILLALGTLFLIAATIFLFHTHTPAPNTDLATLLAQNPTDYALSMGHFLDLTGPALSLFRLPLIIAALALFLGPLASLILRKKSKPHAANLALAAGAFTFLLAAHLGLQTFAPVLTSAQLAKAIVLQTRVPRQMMPPGMEANPQDLIVIHGEYESGSTLAFYLQRADIHILEGRSSNLWYGSFFPDAPPIFETPTSLAAKWPGPQRIFLWQSLTDPPNQLPPLPTPVYILVKSGGKEIVSNQPNH